MDVRLSDGEIAVEESKNQVVERQDREGKQHHR